LAIEKGLFEVYYKPVINVIDNTINGFEAISTLEAPRQGVYFSRMLYSYLQKVVVKLMVWCMGFRKGL
jgi:EAL domain-containing protein (putative c-di-GMP-specific phosphodiesterase class I)